LTYVQNTLAYILIKRTVSRRRKVLYEFNEIVLRYDCELF
jgi:hypothetical protein